MTVGQGARGGSTAGAIERNNIAEAVQIQVMLPTGQASNAFPSTLDGYRCEWSIYLVLADIP